MAETAAPPAGTLSPHTLSRRISRDVRLRYLLALPAGYAADEGDTPRRWPLILFLHGAGERGAALQKVKKHGIPRVVEEGRVADFPFIAAAPQCPEGSRWTVQLEALAALLDDLQAGYRIDPERIYLTGLSMGGFGTWALAAALPARFAAIAPVCGGGDRSSVRRLTHLPTWVFHGAADPTVPLTRSAEMVEALALAGGDVRFTVYPEARHDSWTPTYDNPDLYAWFLSHTRREPGPEPARPAARRGGRR
jgi:predicted peptidase